MGLTLKDLAKIWNRELSENALANANTPMSNKLPQGYDNALNSVQRPGHMPWQSSPLAALGHEFGEYVTAVLKLLESEVSFMYSPHDQTTRAVRSLGSRVHEARVIWCIRHPVLDVTVQWVGDGKGGTEEEWKIRLADMADKIKIEKDWFHDQGKDLPTVPPVVNVNSQHIYGHTI